MPRLTVKQIKRENNPNINVRNFSSMLRVPLIAAGEDVKGSGCFKSLCRIGS
jgi:hypothetical protein